jgi:hypothetical protein
MEAIIPVRSEGELATLSKETIVLGSKAKVIQRLFAATFVIGVCAASLSAQKVTTDYDKTRDFYRIHTYFWANVKAPNDLWTQRIKDSVNAQMDAKGWKMVDESSAEVALSALGTTQDQHQLNTYYSGMGGGWGYRGFGGMGTATTTMTDYKTGTLVLDMFDTKSKQLIWRGVGTDSVAGDPDKNQKKLVKTVQKMFKNFPPKTGGS